MPEGAVEIEFPVWDLLPKRETEVSSFLTKRSDCDGRGFVIAILDSGVDPGAPGLQKTSTGKIKVIERYDCSGCGDVPLSEPVQPKEGYLTGLSGRKFKVPNWTNPTNNYRLGIKSAFDLYPDKLKKRVQDERKEKLWQQQQKISLANANRDLVRFEDANADSTTLSDENKLTKEDIEAKVEILNMLDKKYYDPGPTYDCIVFHDGSKWLACVDTSEQGNLQRCKVLGEYSVTHEYAVLTELDQLNYSINVHNDGETLELVGYCSSHGTHVASIAAAYFPDEPDKNGIAPGAQIVALTIGDGRLGSMETGTSLVRAMIILMKLAKKNSVHIINTSYGEHANWSDSGRVGNLMNEVVNKYGLIWVGSAGNNGPALSTVGCPPDISQDTIIGVGAYVSPDMMVAEYSMRQKLNGMSYTWSSRGPTTDGGFGVSICAPGGAITSVPNFTLRNSQLMNGTSMASPYVAGAIAIILSALKKDSKQWSPYSVKRALENGAVQVDGVEPFAQGQGLLQVEKSYQILSDTSSSPDCFIRFQVTCGVNNGKGIYIRCIKKCPSHEWPVDIEPFFIDTEGIDVSKKISFNLKLALTCSANYIDYPKHLDLSNMARRISIKVLTENLKQGVYFTTIDAYDSSNVGKGPVFRIPVTVIKPQELDSVTQTFTSEKVVFQPNTIKRHFFLVPENATWAVFRMSCLDVNCNGRYVLHCMQILPRKSCKTLETNKTITISSNTENVQSFQVRGGYILEVVIAKYWASLGEMNARYSISFYGIKPNQPQIVMHAADGIHRVDVATLRGEEIIPSINLRNTVQILKPTESKVRPLTARDVIPPGRQIYELVIQYNFQLVRTTEVTPRNPLLSNLLYESEYESQMWMIFDSNKQYMGCGDAYPSKYSIRLERGEYILKTQIRHDRKEYLDKLSDIPMILNQKLPSAVTMDVYSTYSDALIGGKKVSLGQSLTPTIVPLYISPLSADKFSVRTNNVAHYFTGYITFAKDDLGRKVDTYPIKYILHQAPPRRVSKTEKTKSKMEEYTEALRDMKTMWIQKMEKREDAEKLYEEIKKEFPDHLQAHTSILQYIDAMEVKRQLPALRSEAIKDYNFDDVFNKILPICTKTIESIDQNSLLAYFAIKTDNRPDAAKIKTTMERQKSALIDLLCRKGIALCRIYQYEQLKAGAPLKQSASKDDIASIWKNLYKFTDPNDKGTANNVLFFAMWHAAVYNHYGRLLKYLMRYQEDKGAKEVEEKCIEVCELLGWPHVVKYLKNNILSKYPAKYKPF